MENNVDSMAFYSCFAKRLFQVAVDFYAFFDREGKGGEHAGVF